MRFWKNNKRAAWLWGVLLGLGVAQGQLAVIWRKATMICMECIGIG